MKNPQRTDHARTIEQDIAQQNELEQSDCYAIGLTAISAVLAELDIIGTLAINRLSLSRYSCPLALPEGELIVL